MKAENFRERKTIAANGSGQASTMKSVHIVAIFNTPISAESALHCRLSQIAIVEPTRLLEEQTFTASLAISPFLKTVWLSFGKIHFFQNANFALSIKTEHFIQPQITL